MDYTTTISENNYLYISHLNDINGDDFRFWILPFYPESISDSMQSNFNETQALGRSAPVFTFSNAGPRTVQIEMKLHRDMMDDVNIGVSNAKLQLGEDYIDSLIRALQAIAVPRYNLTNKAVEPPIVALRLGNQIFIKGIVSSAISLTYEKPILENDKYARVSVSITISEVDPYDATSVFLNGSFRGEVNTFQNGRRAFENRLKSSRN